MSLSQRAAFPVWWASRTPRERIMLGVLAGLIAVLALWYGVVAPLRRAEAAAEERHARAVERLLSVSASAQEVAALQSARSVGPSGRVLVQAVVQTALANAVPLSRQTLAPSGDLAVSVDSVDPRAAFRWIAALQRDHGVAVSALAMTRNPDRSLSLQIRFSGGGG